MHNVRALYDNAAGRLTEAGIEKREASIEAGLLIEHVFGFDRSFLYAHGDEELSRQAIDKLPYFEELLVKRLSRFPLQQLTHSQAFMGLDFYVDENVLIPRQDTEFLVEEAMIELQDGMSVLDLCTGSGCIIISLMKYKNDIEGVASDISGEALEVCRQNAERHGLSDRLELIKSDLFEGLSEDRLFDAVISNPPYIKTSVIKGLSPEVRDHDPFIALNGHEDGLYFYRRIIPEAKKHLKLSGLLMLEIGADQGEEVAGLLYEEGYSGIEIKKDYSSNDRVVKARRAVNV